MERKNILVLCSGNSCRSQMAEGYLKFYAGTKAKVYSAGLQEHDMHRKALSVMYEDGIDLRPHTSNLFNDYTHIDFDYVITVCDYSEENCPPLAPTTQKFHYSFPDPTKAEGTIEEIRTEFRRVRDMIKVYCRDFVDVHLSQKA
jgi:arsenate reductase